MCFFFSFMPATFWLVVGYFVLFSATRAEGRIEKFGRVLATWIFFISGAILMVGAYITLNGFCSIEALMSCAG
jgi:ABC-type Fe3+ transport system permease subunit